MPESLVVQSHVRAYTAHFVTGWVETCAALIKDRRAFVIVDSAIRDRFASELRALPENRVHFVDATESVKTLEGCKDLAEVLSDRGVRRGDILVAIGGGVVQDLVSFTASILYRGLDWVFVPTTLLAQADSCIGGKTSINVGARKNLVGNFYPPVEIYVDSSFLTTLPDLEIRSGIGEMMHYYVYANSPLLPQLVADYEAVIQNRTLLAPFVQEALRIKRSVIEVDEFDKGVRNLFNYGHTFGHALESLTDFEIRHGQAVTVGMCLANVISERLGIMSSTDATELNQLLAVNLPQHDLSEIDLDQYFRLLSKDKKNVGEGTLTCILAEASGKLVIRTLPVDTELRAWVAEFFRNDLPRLVRTA